MFFLAISTRTRSAEPNIERGSARVRVCQKQEEKSATRSGICFFLAISTRTRSAEPNMERDSARVRVCKKQEEKARREAAFVFFLRYQREPVRRSRTWSATARGYESAKSKKKKRDAKRHLFFSCDINENPFGGAEHGARQREGTSLQKARRKSATRSGICFCKLGHIIHENK